MSNGTRPRKDYGVSTPLAAPAETKVRIDAEAPLDELAKCPTGVICVRGFVEVPDGETLGEVRARIYHKSDNLPDHPPTNASQGVISGIDFVFDHVEDNEVPRCRCNNKDGRDDNWLVVWANWVSRLKQDEAKATTPAWPWMRIMQVNGVCSDTTECQS